ncbi:GNAT family N-acetyltransferase [Embleya sp. NBC_00896]|uniref:bifunctional acetate--CoA ligase family protein/GNAT family N-acetyltransferase n=1 Tax=Embleya sp. NBC_00896 TaxID=2975961 RepID=UPI00386AE7BB|nr:GNAT family N-acetyltransferase [Embleya sp. NBC_00896]
MTATGTPPEIWALAADGETILLRRPRPDDEGLILAMHHGMSAENLHLRFFGISDISVRETAKRVGTPDRPGCGALLALTHDEKTVIGVAEYNAEDMPDEAELALAVADAWHGRGVGTLLIEHLIAMARADGIRTLLADTLPWNRPMLRVIEDMGLPGRNRLVSGVVNCAIDLDTDDVSTERYLTAMAVREAHADVAALVPLFTPRSIAVAGAGHRADSVGRALLRNLKAAHYTGSVVALHPTETEVDGVPAYATPSLLPVVPDLVVVAVPASAVPDLVEECGRAGVRALLVVTSGLTPEQRLRVRTSCRRHGMRMVGPNCLGIAQTDPATALNATFGWVVPAPGSAGVAVQSGGVGIALMEQLNRLGIGVSTFASLGDKYDVSGNDMLQWWQADARTTMAILHLESFGNPRKFSRIARTVGRTKPVLTVDAGRSAAGRRAAGSHTAAAVTPTVARGALFRQAGVTATHTLGDLVAVAALLHAQPLPDGAAVAVIGNAGGAGVLAADACVDAGLVVPRFGADLEGELRALLPAGAACANPVDTTATVDGETLRRCVDRVLAAGHVDAVVLALAPTALGDPLGDLLTGPAVRERPVVVVAPERAAAVELLPAVGGAVPVYCDARTAAVALAHAHERAMWLTRPRGTVPPLVDVDRAGVRSLVAEFLARESEGGWLPPKACARILAAYGITVTPWRQAFDAEEAVAMGRELAPLGAERAVVLKACGPEIVHKSDVGGVRLRLVGDDAVRAAFADLAHRIGALMESVVVQPMAHSGVELIAGVTQDEVLGPLVVFGLGGVATDVLGDHGARLTPLTDLDAHALLAGSRGAPLLYGHRGARPTDTAGIENILHRLSRLADDVPQLVEADLNPLIARPDGVTVVDARIRLAPRTGHDPYLRRLR